jgi:hypothetical protein
MPGRTGSAIRSLAFCPVFSTHASTHTLIRQPAAETSTLLPPRAIFGPLVPVVILHVNSYLNSWCEYA